MKSQKSQMRIRTGLLSRVSTLAILAAAGALGSVQQAQAACDTPLVLSGPGPDIISTDQECVQVTGTTAAVTNNANVGDPGDGDPGFFIGGEGSITGELLNNDTISGGGGSDRDGALTLGSGANVAGGIRNTGQITSSAGNGINLGYGTSDVNYSAAMTGNITNSAGIHGAVHGVAALYGTMSGNLTNNSSGDITGGDVAVYIDDDFTSWSGGIFNSGNIAGDNAGIQVGSFFSGKGDVVFSGGISNFFGGMISSLNGPAIVAGGSSFSGGIYNAGSITQRDLTAAGGESAYAGVGILVTAETFNDGITNTGQIDGLGGPAIWITSNTTTFNGPITNSGNIDGADEGLLFEGQTFAGSFNNSGNIHGDISGVDFANSSTDISDGAEGNAQFTNTGSISGAAYGVRILGDTVDMDFTNTNGDPLFFPPGQISADTGAALLLSANTWNGDVTNDGILQGGAAGLVLGGLPSSYSSVLVSGSAGAFNGTVTNTGQITGGDYGLFAATESFDGDFNNSGLISGDVGAAFVGASFDFIFANKGIFNGTVTNTGSIVGGTTGLVMNFDTITGDIINDVGGYISGGNTGAFISANSLTGDIVNNGVITGFDDDTGLHIVTGTHIGDIINNGTLSASGNTLFADIGNLTGSIVNTGLIEVNPGQTAVNLLVDNGATFVNTGGGIVLGDILFGGKAPYNFIGEDGGVEGDLIGQGGEGGSNDDTVTVQNGTQYFFFGGKGGGTASNFATFNVEDGGVAIMGARFEGDTNGSGYAFSNVDAVNVNDGGTLYIDKSTTLNVDNSYTQQSGGTLEFFLGAPGGEGFSGLTGTQVADPLTDYGQVHVSGAATLDGAIAGFLDPAFASANANLDAVEYHDVLVADGGITGDFTALALISNSSLFELNEIIDGNTVDLVVTRASLTDIGTVPSLLVQGPFDSMVSDRSNGIGSGSCGMAGPGWCFNRFAANEPGATQVMTDASPGEDPFAWLRTGVRRVGETAVWGRAVGVWGNTDGDLGVGGSEFQVVGAIAGIDHVFTPILMAGVAGQWTTTDVDFDGRPDNADVDSFEAGAYMSYGDTRLYLNANASVIWHNIEVNRFSAGGQAFGDYDGTTISGYAEVGKIFETYEGFRIQPLVAVSYSHLETDAYSETGSAFTLLNVFDSEFDTLKGMVGARFAYPVQMASGRKIVPEARIVWAHEFMDDQSSFIATTNLDPVTQNLIKGEEFSRDTIVLGTGLTAPLSEATTLFVDYDAGLNEDITTHTVSAGLRLRW